MKNLIVFLMVSCSLPILAGPVGALEAARFERAIRNGRFEERTTRAIDRLVKQAAHELWIRGHRELSVEIEEGWRENQNFVYELRDWRGLGDHPGVVWMLEAHEKIEGVLGLTLCRLLRLHDLWRLGTTIKVVFQCVDAVDTMEYQLHFVEFAGVVSYWVSWAICCGATWGAGAIGLICSPISLGCEFIVMKAIAPRISDRFWKLACQ